MSVTRRMKIGLSALAFAGLLSSAPMCAAQDDATTREAAKHFQIGVTLYSEADYRAALVEFQRAYAVAPNVAVLYNVAEAQYQLQDYSGALATFERYLGQTPATDARRDEVEQTLDVLRTRVGHLSIDTDPRGADVAVDDQPMGKTPFDRAIPVSVGRRKVTVWIADRPPVTRYVDVAAQDTVSVSLQVPAASSDVAFADAAAARAAGRTLLPARSQTTAHSSAPVFRAIGWTVTGVLAAGASTFGILALKASSDLKQERETYPTTSATLEHDASVTKTYSVLADSMTAAAIALGTVTLVSTLSSPAPGRRESASARVWLGPTSAHFAVTF